MGRKPRHQHERCKLPDARRTGANLAWLVVVLVTAWQTASPTLRCNDQPLMADAGTPLLPGPVSAEVLADAAVAMPLLAAFPAPSTGQKRPPCPTDAVEGAGGCWRRTTRKPPCDYFEAEEAGACYMAVPERPKGRPVAGGG